MAVFSKAESSLMARSWASSSSLSGIGSSGGRGGERERGDTLGEDWVRR